MLLLQGLARHNIAEIGLEAADASTAHWRKVSVPGAGAAALQPTQVLAADPEDIEGEKPPAGPQQAAAVTVASAMPTEPASSKITSERGDILPVRATASLRAIDGAVRKAARPPSRQRSLLLPGTGAGPSHTASHAMPAAGPPAGTGLRPLCRESETSSIASPASSKSLSIASADGEEHWLAEAHRAASKVAKAAKPPAWVTGAKQPTGATAGRTPGGTLAKREQQTATAGAAAASERPRAAAGARLQGRPSPHAGHHAAGPTLQNNVQGSSTPSPVPPSCSALAVTPGQEATPAAARGQEHTLPGKQAAIAHMPRASELTGSRGSGVQQVAAASGEVPGLPKQACPDKPSKPAKGILKVHWHMRCHCHAAWMPPQPGHVEP